MKKITIFIDESGTFPDPKDKIVIIAAVGINLPKILLNVTKKVREKIKPKKKEKKISEIKFYRAGERTKLIYLKELLKEDIDIFTLVIDKNNQSIADTPENFALISYILINECILFYGNNIDKIIFDKHFHREKDQKKFNKILTKLLKKRIKLYHLDSKENPEINAADMIAGSLLWKYTGKDDKFYKIIEKEIISENYLKMEGNKS